MILFLIMLLLMFIVLLMMRSQGGILKWIANFILIIILVFVTGVFYHAVRIFGDGI